MSLYNNLNHLISEVYCLNRYVLGGKREKNDVAKEPLPRLSWQLFSSENVVVLQVFSMRIVSFARGAFYYMKRHGFKKDN